MYSLPEYRGRNGRAFRPLSSANTHKRNFVFSPWTAGNPCSPRTDGNPYIRHTHTHTHTHTPTDMLQFIFQQRDCTLRY